MVEVLSQFHPAVRRWFDEHYPSPTPPQELGWPVIQRGEHTLILSPTGSGKTMAAFLWGISDLFCRLEADPQLSGVQLLYISPLKALNNDVERNLRWPLAGIRQVAESMGSQIVAPRVMVRTGDTASSERQRMVRKPPHILITTPESLYLILTSSRAAEMLSTVRTVIVDEIHTLCGNKRGVHLALSLERLGRRTGGSPQRIGLSATQRPLDEVARFLVGQEWEVGEDGRESLVSRPVTIIDAGTQKDLDLQVVTTVPDLRRLPGGSVWPALIPDVLNEIRGHRTTLIFTNSRRGAERCADRLNEQYAREEAEEIPPGSSEGLLSAEGVPVAQGMFGSGRQGGPFRAHHGSVSREVRTELERQLKEGRLPALIATSSLELGIDIGSVDEVIQIQSPKGIARGLQRVGRSGHLVGQTSVGRIYATYREDLLDAAAVAHGMLAGDIEPTHTPQNCLDVLSQQVVAMVSQGDWEAPTLYRLVRQAYGYQGLARDAFQAVLDMLSGKYPGEVYRELRPRISYDRVNDRLAALPGSRNLAIYNGGTISDRGLFRVMLPDQTVLGSLDEEFVFETRVGDVFTLGSGTWRVTKIEDDRVVVAGSEGSMPRMPFWRGEAPRREYHMGLRTGAFRRELASRVAALPPLPDYIEGPWPAQADAVAEWLQVDYAMDDWSARNAIHYVRQQLNALGAISSDDTVIVEVFNDALGDQRMAVHSCFGGRVNSAWALALGHAFRDRFGLDVESQVNDDGMLFRFLQSDRDLPVDIVREMGSDEARERLLLELANSALFGAQFRMNAARALLLPSVRGSNKRTPFWLQRLRAKELLAVTRGLADFPIVAETYRDCLSDVLDLPALMEVLDRMRAGRIRVVEMETLVPSPVAAALLASMAEVGMYEDDLPKAERQMQALTLNRELLSQLMEEGLLPDLLRPEAVASVEAELQHVAEGHQARGVEELAVIMQELGDLTTEEVVARCAGEGRAWLLQLVAQGRVLQVSLSQADGARESWVPAEALDGYRAAFGPRICDAHDGPDQVDAEPPEAARLVLLRTLMAHCAPLQREAILARYAFPEDWLDAALDELRDSGHLVRGRLSPASSGTEWCDRRVLERIHRRTLALLRGQVRPVERAAYQDFCVRWQGLHPDHRRAGREGLTGVLQQFRGYAAPAVVWERDLLPSRQSDYHPDLLDALCAQGDLVWAASGSEARHARVRFFFRGEGGRDLGGEEGQERPALSEDAQKVLDFLRQEGTSYTADLKVLGLSTSGLHAALEALLLSGLVTNDRFAALRDLLDGQVTTPDTHRGIASSLDADLESWRRARAPSTLQRPSHGRLRDARRAVAQRVAAPLPWAGCWSILRRRGIWGDEQPPHQRAAWQARQLLQRYGIVTRESLEQETGADWGEIYRQLQLMELRGEVRRGYLVRGLPGAQFALPEAVEKLREWNAPHAEGAEALVLVNACDPAYVGASSGGQERDEEANADASDTLLGEGVPDETGLRCPRLPSNYVVCQRGVVVLTYEHGGGRWCSAQGLSGEGVRRAVELVRGHATQAGGLCARPQRVLVARWNGVSPLGSAAQPVLEGLGFRREAGEMVWDGL
ncbi:MAG: DEAD/DEAH box helicase [Anaerolineae bacterium]